MRIMDIMFKEPEIKDLEFDGLAVVKSGPISAGARDIVWHLPGGVMTDDWDLVRDYCSGIRRDQLHIKGQKKLKEMKDDIARYTSCD